MSGAPAQGCVHIYTGDGKGKTTAAIGLALRALGQGRRVALAQFLKDGSSGEVQPLRGLGAEVFFAGDTAFVWQMDAAARAEAAARQAALLGQMAKLAPKCDVLVLDEAVCACVADMLPRQALEDFVAARPAGLELVLTGRGAWGSLISRADYVTEMLPHKHPFERGLAARQGIEF